MSSPLQCPRCFSKRVLTKHTGRKDKTPSPQTILNAIVGGLVGGVAGCAAGSAFGDALDQAVFDNYECLDCGYSFSCFSHSLRSS